jgi:hypothetical protein
VVLKGLRAEGWKKNKVQEQKDQQEGGIIDASSEDGRLLPSCSSEPQTAVFPRH